MYLTIFFPFHQRLFTRPINTTLPYIAASSHTPPPPHYITIPISLPHLTYSTLHNTITPHLLTLVFLHALVDTHTFHLNKTDGASPSAMASATRPNCHRLPEGLYRSPSCCDPLEGDGYHGCRWRGASGLDRAGDNSDTGCEVVRAGRGPW